ncbi:PREDICTED: interleukin-2 receptor subunit beta isoform X1 [Propithecus coquereli]|uniref:interleukin-2 receptor subunit beta isoform X1 n=1 Tax=Propithecus coquereli TaxID=379532 RepID=UPI00063FC153|nr:PREDICTED: interleukin-2 receptor subunit beta isoform X1 [Propithecus coquereli]XP_012493495.1 PREDICTED: interleukin-2 receptor subunit beta isoform X1 [Propithecus coquereli]
MAAPALSWRLSLLILLPLAACRASAAVNDTSQLTCFYNSKANISCVWSRDGGLRGASCHIHAQSNKRSWNKTCELVPVGQTSWACNLILGAPDSQTLTAADTVNMNVMCQEGKRWSVVMSQAFKPFENLRLMAPVSLQVSHVGTHGCNVTWALSHSSHYIESYLEFEGRTRSPGQSWETARLLTLKQKQQWISLETLTPDTHYELQVRVKPQLGDHSVWSPWSQPLAFRTRPAAPRKETPPLPGLDYILMGLSAGAVGFIILVYLLVNSRDIGPWLKKVLKCHIPDPSQFFSQLSSEHGGDFQKWLSSPFPSSSFSHGGPAPEISPLEVLERDAKAAQLLLLQQDKVASPSPSTSGHSLTSCFTNQGYFFFHLPDALEIEACQVYFTYDPCTEEEAEEGAGGPGVPVQPPLPPLQPLSGEDDAYCTFPPGEDLLLFSPNLLGGSSPPNTARGGSGAGEERLPPSLQEGVPRHWASQPPRPPTPRSSDLVDFQSPPELALGEAGEEVPVPSSGEGAGFPWACPPRQGQDRAPTSHLTPITDVYLSLQELQDQDPAHSV